MDSVLQAICIPEDKIIRALDCIDALKGKKKITLKNLQQLCGFLNFLCRAVAPGRAFTRRLYAHTSKVLKPHHHIKITGEMKADLLVWRLFLNHPSIYCRPFIDVKPLSAEEINMYSDATRNFTLGFGAFCDSSWIQGKWCSFVRKVKPSIEYLELFGVTVAVLLWIKRFQNKRIILFTDNESAMHMINNSSSSCRNCMVLVRLIVLEGLKYNVRIFAKHIKSEDNSISDALSRGQWARFRRLTRKRNMEEFPTGNPEEIWPIEKIWLR